MVLAGGGEITLDHLPAVIAEAAPASIPVPSLREATNGATPAAVRPLIAAAREFEKVHLRRAVAATGGKRVKAAEMLGISRKSLWEKLRMYDLEEAVRQARGLSTPCAYCQHQDPLPKVGWHVFCVQFGVTK